jgi:hypothetical protein
MSFKEPSDDRHSNRSGSLTLFINKRGIQIKPAAKDRLPFYRYSIHKRQRSKQPVDSSTALGSTTTTTHQKHSRSFSLKDLTVSSIRAYDSFSVDAAQSAMLSQA